MSLQPFRYGGAWGYRTSRSTGLLQLGQRWYWPQVGRFTQQDPSGEEDNWYTYADSNPVTEIDPDGLSAFVFSAGEIVATQFTVGQGPERVMVH